MTDFLTFLNTAGLDTLTKVPGISHGLAENIIAARPFDFVEDALHVKGMGKNLLGRMQSYFEAELNPSEDSAMIAVEEEAEPAPMDESTPRAESHTTHQPSFVSRTGRAILNFVVLLLKLSLILVIIAGIGAALYFYGIPYVQQTLITPMEQNTAHIGELSSKVSALNEEMGFLQSQLDETNSRIDTVEKTIEVHTASLTRLEEMQVKLDKELQAGNETIALQLKRDIILTRSIEFLSRGLLYFSQSNFGLAREDVQSARDLLMQLREDAPEYQVNTFDQVIGSLDKALENLPAFPVIAVNHVNIAWQMLMNGLPESQADAAIRPTMQMTPTPTITPPTTTTPTVSPTP